MTKRKWLLLGCCLALLILVVWTVWSTYALKVTTFTVSSPYLPEGFEGFRIAHISDLHSAEFGKDNETLLQKLREAEPDIIVVTGDLLDSYEPEVEISASFMEEAVKIAPCYYVCGNHELRLPMEYAQLRDRMKACGVTVLEDRAVSLERNGDSIQVLGLTDYKTVSAEYIAYLSKSNGYTLLLTHRPEHFAVYDEAGMDLILAGHTHGGQVRLPLLSAIFAPGQGMFPTYDDGLHQSGSTSMVISRGLGNSSLPFRFNCRPELVIIDLETE